MLVLDLSGGPVMGVSRGRSESVRKDWFTALPAGMDRLFDTTRWELESSNTIMSVTLDEALCLCQQGEIELSLEQAAVFSGLFDRVALRLRIILMAVKQRGTRFPVLPQVTALAPGNFRGAKAQRISRTNNLLANVVFHARTRFFHKIYGLGEITEDLLVGVREIVEGIDPQDLLATNEAWQKLEVLAYDLNTCTSEVTVVLKSFLHTLPDEELNGFQQELTAQVRRQAVIHANRIEFIPRK